MLLVGYEYETVSIYVGGSRLGFVLNGLHGRKVGIQMAGVEPIRRQQLKFKIRELAGRHCLYRCLVDLLDLV